MAVTLKLKQLRENHPDKPSQRVLADVLGIAEANYRNLENGRNRSITFEYIDKLVKYFNCTPNDIFSVTED